MKRLQKIRRLEIIRIENSRLNRVFEKAWSFFYAESRRAYMNVFISLSFSIILLSIHI